MDFLLEGAFGVPGSPLEELDMLDRSLEAEFESYRKTLSTDEARNAHSTNGLSAS